MNLLVIDDEREVVDALQCGIDWKEIGIGQVYTADSAAEGREIMQNASIDLLLCDIEMPRENGLSLCRWAKDRYPDLECIFLTSHAEFDYAREALLLGSCDYILQPASYKEIAVSVRRAIEKIRKKKERSLMERQGREIMDSFLKLLGEQAESAAQETDPRPEQQPAEGNAVENAALESSCSGICLREDEEQERIRKVTAYIRNHLDEDLSRNELAEHVHLNPEYLSKYFKKQTGLLLKDYIFREKMNLAKQLLANTNLSINMVATRIGYFNFSHFSQAFRRAEGLTPGEYRQAKKSENQTPPPIW